MAFAFSQKQRGLKIAGLLAGILGVEVSLDIPLAEAGLDSIGSVELRNAISQMLGTELPATIAFDYPTIASMARYIAERSIRQSEGVEGATQHGEDASAQKEAVKQVCREL